MPEPLDQTALLCDPFHEVREPLARDKKGNLYVMQGKLRPAVVVQTIMTDNYNLQNPEPYVWVAPCFTFEKRGTQAGVSMPDRRDAVSTPLLCPCSPERLCGKGVLHFEHIQPVATDGVQPIFCNGKQSFLTDAAWAVLQQRLYLFVSGKVLDQAIEDTLQTYRACLLEAYGLH